MNSHILTADAPPPEQTVVLELSVGEFAVIEALRCTRLSGANSLRESIDAGFESCYQSLHPSNRALVRAARNAVADAKYNRGECVADAVGRLFGATR